MKDALTPPNPTPLRPTSTPADAGGAAAATPANATTLCCWCDKFETQVATHGTDYVVSSQHRNHRVKFKLTVDLAGNEVVVTSVLKWNGISPTVTAAETEAIRSGLITSVMAICSGRFQLKVTDPACHPSTRILNIRFRVRWEESGSAPSDLLIDLVPGPAESGVFSGMMLLDTEDAKNGGQVLAHEFLHTLGQIDEYMYGGATSGTADYHRADGSTETITLPQTGNIMATGGSVVFVPRFFYFIEIEAQKLLRSASGMGRAGVTCEIV